MLLVPIRFHKLGAHLIDSNNLPPRYKVSQYLKRCLTSVLLDFVHISPVVWIMLMATANLMYFASGIIPSTSGNEMEVYSFFSAFIAIVMMLCFVAIAFFCTFIWSIFSPRYFTWSWLFLMWKKRWLDVSHILYVKAFSLASICSHYIYASMERLQHIKINYYQIHQSAWFVLGLQSESRYCDYPVHAGENDNRHVECFFLTHIINCRCSLAMHLDFSLFLFFTKFLLQNIICGVGSWWVFHCCIWFLFSLWWKLLHGTWMTTGNLIIGVWKLHLM